MFRIQNYINGEFLNPISETYIENYEPATGKVYSLIPDSDDRDVALAVKAASDAFPEWSKISQRKRFKYLFDISQRILARLDEFATAESKDNGKPLALATVMDIPRAAENFEFYATALLHTTQEAYQTNTLAINYTMRHPLGVVGCISPWNLPLYLFSWKIAPALASGNCVVAKPSEVTPFTSYLLSTICEEVGLPKGVLNLVHGYGHKAGQAIVTHPEVKAISFTGGTVTGKAIAKATAESFKKLSLELGGKNPNIIFDDCDFEKALDTTVRSSFANQGQICLCGSRIFIHTSIYEKFKAAFLARVEKLTVGDPSLDHNLGAVVSKSHKDKILSYIALAKEEGGVLLHGGEEVHPEGRCKDGYFIAPTVFENLPYTCRVNQEEVFGPFVTLTPFTTEEEVLKMANSTVYGLAASVWTQDISKAQRMAQRLESGIVWVNCWLLRDLRTPFGGVKHSGMGREGGFEALKFFTEEKNVCISY